MGPELRAQLGPGLQNGVSALGWGAHGKAARSRGVCTLGSSQWGPEGSEGTAQWVLAMWHGPSSPWHPKSAWLHSVCREMGISSPRFRAASA